MKPGPLHALLLFVAAGVFTIGLTFATVELPYVIDHLLQNLITTPDGDSHADAPSRLKTELFISHYRLRLAGYVCFILTVLLILAGFATRRSGLAAVGAAAFMLPVFAQFAAVMFFLAGLGVLNILWLPVLDISFGMQDLGGIVRAPLGFAAWLSQTTGVRIYRPLVYLCVGGGLLLFFLGTLAWLSARARGKNVADFWVYRISRHPQYLGWIIWSYGVFLLLQQGRYPKRSWGIHADLSWLLSTMVIVGVAMLEELNMSRRHGAAYDAYRRNTPFLLPLPGLIPRLFAFPCRLLFGKDEPERKREVAVIISLYTLLLITASVFFYGDGWARTRAAFTPEAMRRSRMEETARRIREHPDPRAKYFLAEKLAASGDPAVDYFVRLLADEQAEVRSLAAEELAKLPSARAVPSLVEALHDPHSNVRYHATRALGGSGAPGAAAPLLRRLEDPDCSVRMAALGALSALGVQEVADTAIAWSASPQAWVRTVCVRALGTLRAEGAVPALIRLLGDEQPQVRREAVVALLQIGSPGARQALEDATRDEDWEVRVYAAEALKRLSSTP